VQQRLEKIGWLMRSAYVHLNIQFNWYRASFRGQLHGIATFGENAFQNCNGIAAARWPNGRHLVHTAAAGSASPLRVCSGVRTISFHLVFASQCDPQHQEFMSVRRGSETNSCTIRYLSYILTVHELAIYEKRIA
jgi:hypothetical protein